MRVDAGNTFQIGGSRIIVNKPGEDPTNAITVKSDRIAEGNTLHYRTGSRITETIHTKEHFRERDASQHERRYDSSSFFDS